MSVRALVFAALAVCVSVQPTFGQNAAPVAKAIEATSLYRPDNTWDVRTAIVMSVEDADSHGWTFSLVQPETLKDGKTSRVVCPDPTDPTNPDKSGLNTMQPLEQTTLLCYYSPKIDFSGEETFKYQVKDKEGALSQPVEVKITVQHGGLRWEFITNGKSALSSDSANSSTLPSIIGSTAQDYLFRLDWAVRNPHERANVANPRGGAKLIAAVAEGQRIGTRVKHTSNAHFKFETGFTTQSQAATTTPETTTTTGTGGAATPAAGETPAVVQQRKFTAGGEFNYNAVFAPDDGGTFLEVGALARGHLDAAVEDPKDAQTVGKQFVTVLRKGTGAGTFRSELGFRVALKQYADGPLRTVVKHNDMDSPTFRRNSDNLMEFELGYRRDTALKGLDVLNITENRYVVRVTAMPELPVPGHVRANLGVELTGGFGKDSPKEVKILYGVGTAALGLFR